MYRSPVRSKAEMHLNKLREKVGGAVIISANGVPHLVVTGRGGLSVSYFRSTRQFKVFGGYATALTKQPRMHFGHDHFRQMITSINETKNMTVEEYWAYSEQNGFGPDYVSGGKPVKIKKNRCTKN